MCVDYRKLNKMPRVEELIEQLGDSKYTTTLSAEYTHAYLCLVLVLLDGREWNCIDRKIYSKRVPTFRT